MCTPTLYHVRLGNWWTKFFRQLKRLNGKIALAPLIDHLQFPDLHGTLQTHFFQTPKTKGTPAPDKVASAQGLYRPATGAWCPDRLGINDGDPGRGSRRAFSALRPLQRHFEGPYFASDSQRSRGRRSVAGDFHGDLEPGEKLLFAKGQAAWLDGHGGPDTSD